MRYIYRDIEHKCFYCKEVNKNVDVTLTVAEVPDSGEVVVLKKVKCTAECPLAKNRKCLAFEEIK